MLNVLKAKQNGKLRSRKSRRNGSGWGRESHETKHIEKKLEIRKGATTKIYRKGEGTQVVWRNEVYIGYSDEMS